MQHARAAAGAVVRHDRAEQVRGVLVAERVGIQRRLAAAVLRRVRRAHVVTEFVGERVVRADAGIGRDAERVAREVRGQRRQDVPHAAGAAGGRPDDQHREVGAARVAGGVHVFHDAVASVAEAAQVEAQVAGLGVVGLLRPHQPQACGDAAVAVGRVGLGDAEGDACLHLRGAAGRHGGRRCVHHEDVERAAVVVAGDRRIGGGIEVWRRQHRLEVVDQAAGVDHPDDVPRPLDGRFNRVGRVEQPHGALQHPPDRHQGDAAEPFSRHMARPGRGAVAVRFAAIEHRPYDPAPGELDVEGRRLQRRGVHRHRARLQRIHGGRHRCRHARLRRGGAQQRRHGGTLGIAGEARGQPEQERTAEEKAAAESGAKGVSHAPSLCKILTLGPRRASCTSWRDEAHDGAGPGNAQTIHGT